jgi:nifR3 family TIM-barrel protein
MDPRYISEVNQGVAPARPGELQPLKIGPIEVWPPVVLAPMAGVTNPPFRTLCRRFGAGLYVSEMITARPLVEDHPKTWKLAEFAPGEAVRSLQLYGVDPHYVGEAVKRLVGEGHVDHIDMNFGCPVRKVTRKGGGSAIPARPALLRAIVRAAVQSAGDVPVTIKFRVGINDRVLTHLEAGRIGEEEGCAAVALHARTAAQLYDGHARWEAIAELKQAVRTIPVLGNGDIWEAFDALRMMRETGCDGVVVGRGCLGRPWLFGDLAAVFDGRMPPDPPTFGEIREIMLAHARLMIDWLGDELHAMRGFRKHAGWYTKSFPGSSRIRPQLLRAESLAALGEILAEIPPETPFPPTAMRVRRGKSAGTQSVALPEGWLERPDDATVPEGADEWHSGG